MTARTLADVRFLIVPRLAAEIRRGLVFETETLTGSILPPSDRRRRLGRRFRSFPFLRVDRRPLLGGESRCERPVSESSPWNSPGTGGPASACAARTPSSSTTPTPPSSARPVVGSPATWSRSATPTTRRSRRRRSGSRATAGRSIPTSLEAAFVLDGPGEYEVHDVLVTGVRTYRDDARGRGARPAGRVRDRARRHPHDPPRRHRPPADRGEARRHRRVDVACVPIGGALSATRAAALVAQLDPKIVVPMTVCEDEADCDEALKKFLHEMGAGRRPGEARRDDVELPTETTSDPGVARQVEAAPRARASAASRAAPRWRRISRRQPPRRWTMRPA